MDWHLFGSAIALMLIFEGLTPFLLPRRLKGIALMLLKLDDRAIRGMGLLSMAMGLLILSLSK